MKWIDKYSNYLIISIRLGLLMNYRERIAADPDIMLGKPIIKGTRITVELILKKMSEKQNIEEILKSYPQLKMEDIYAVLAYSADVIGKEEVIAC